MSIEIFFGRRLVNGDNMHILVTIAIAVKDTGSDSDNKVTEL